ncbi:ferredoxin--NADP reductase [Ruegeria sp. R14_0]|uniref:ferredoxin--NADP reductase n=1 Tax=Ruegeria sp. R14_0 TaxID=2821100 RepID=UPI001ADA101F|nr:ferredoxin--NADP reductase [Ruegeria sp. R14_0]MBO9446792.1 ferredoxin--NADP reductase [Ruegeria sp. R14_0]
MTRDFHPLTVRDVREEIGGQAKSVMFDVPPHLTQAFAWRAGQHVTLRFQIKGEEVRRSYSISSSPVSGDPLRITVKRVKKGLVSNHINDTVQPGDVIYVMPPFGSFCLDTDPTERRTHYFLGAGSGITPLHSMLQSVLLAEPWSFVHLVYGNANADSILFKDAFAEYQEGFAGRLTVQHVLSKPSMWSSFDYWRRGNIDKDAVQAFLAENPPYAQNAQYYICGPGGMNGSVKEALMLLDVPANRIHLESYSGAPVADDGIKGVNAVVDITLNGQRQSVEITSGQTILQAAQKAGLEPPYSCQSGVCGACRCKLKKGSVHMRARTALDDAEIAKGAVLSCQAVATAEKVAVTYD